jgi:hypothetical protein
MKIGIFGDSFGDDYNMWPDPYSGVGHSWVDYLRSHNLEIDNYSCGGASLFYSYQKFISTYQEYDKIIFLVTSSGRISVPLGNTTEEFNVSALHHKLRNCADAKRKIQLTAIRDYFMYVKNDIFDNLVHKLLLEDISKKHNSMLMIPCFANSGIDNQIPLVAIPRFEADFWNMEEVMPWSDTEYDARKCHMGEENNLMLGQEIHNWVRTENYNLNQENFKTPTKEFTHYFRTDPIILRSRQK